MCSRYLHVLTVVAAVVVWLRPNHARAWVETSIRSHLATVDLERDGRANVTHELVIKVRGGPLKSVSIDGVDDDAVLDERALVTRLDRGTSSEWPLLLHKSDDGTVTLEVDDDKGLRSGVYTFRFGYWSNFVERDLLQQRGALVRLSWAGPRLQDGIDSAKALFRVPKGDGPPRLPNDEEASDGLELPAAGLIVSQLRRSADKDELELVRPHVAKGEPALWELSASANSFDAFTVPDLPAAPATTSEPLELPRLSVSWLGLAFALALVYAALVGLKWRCALRVALLKQAKPRALVPLPIAARAALAGVLLAGALLVAISVSYPTLAGVLLVLSMLFSSQLPPESSPSMRGPGSWERLSDAQAFASEPRRLPGRWLDSGTLPGFAVFLAGLSMFSGLALLLFAHSPYHALVAALGAACLLPIFFTGRTTELPPDPVERPRRLFSSLARWMRREPGWRVTALARMPEGKQEPDELRLLIEPDQMPRGLLALELALEYQVGSGAVVDLPCLIVRALDDSPAYYALGRGVVWSRGRSASERVALLRPKLPTRSMCAELSREVVALLRQATTHAADHALGFKRSKMSCGSSLTTSKSGSAAPSQRM